MTRSTATIVRRSHPGVVAAAILGRKCRTPGRSGILYLRVARWKTSKATIRLPTGVRSEPSGGWSAPRDRRILATMRCHPDIAATELHDAAAHARRNTRKGQTHPIARRQPTTGSIQLDAYPRLCGLPVTIERLPAIDRTHK